MYYSEDGFFHVISEPFVPLEEKEDIFLAVLHYIFSQKTIKKLLVEDWTFDLKRRIEAKLPALSLVARRGATFVWPVLQLSDFDEHLRGRKWKRMRYIKNIFFKKPQLSVKDASEVDKSCLKQLVQLWKSQKRSGERVYDYQYINAIERQFIGCDIKKVVLLDGKPVALTAGWRIANSGGYYSFLDIHNYNCQYAGEFANLIVLLELKQKQFSFIDFGGSDKRLFAYKMKFHPSNSYKTSSFYIARK